jgi:hypothetical protein
MDDNETRDEQLLNNEDIPDASPEDADQLRNLRLGGTEARQCSYCVPHPIAWCPAQPTDNSMPDLQSVSDDEDWTDEECGGGSGVVVEDDEVMRDEEDPRGNTLDPPRDIGTEPITSFAGAVIEATDTPKAGSELYDSGASPYDPFP